MILIDTEE